MNRILLLLFVLLSFKANAQELNDRIFTKEGDSIICKITLIEKNWLYYDHRGKKSIRNDYIHKDDISYYIYNGKPYEKEPKEKSKEYTEIVIVDSTITKNELYSTFMDWLAKTYVSAKDVIQYQDKEEGKIVAKGLFKVYLNGVYGATEVGNIHHTISIYVKEGKYKYVIGNIYFEGKAYGESPINGEKPWGMLQGQWKKINDQSNSEIDKIILSLKSSVNITKKNKDW